MVSVWDPLRPEKLYAQNLIGKIRKTHPSSKVAQTETAAQKQKKILRQYSQQQNHSPKQLLFLHAKELMSSPVATLSPTTSLEEAYQQFINKRYRHFPVVEGSKIVGILSDRDLLLEGFGHTVTTKTVQDVMSHPVLTVDQNTEIHLLAKILLKERIGALPITNNKTIIGIITRSDILRALSETEIFEVNA